MLSSSPFATLPHAGQAGGHSVRKRSAAEITVASVRPREHGQVDSNLYLVETAIFLSHRRENQGRDA